MTSRSVVPASGGSKCPEHASLCPAAEARDHPPANTGKVSILGEETSLIIKLPSALLTRLQQWN